MSSRPKSQHASISELKVAVDSETGKKYKKGKFLGKGGFAHCYELIDTDNGHIYAGKIVSKSMLTKPHQKEKMTMEIEIHRILKHEHIVGFHGFFEDSNHVYILLELCRRRSLMELHKRRRALTEPEVRYFVRQVLLAVSYLHREKVIHRDLKLGNLFLNDDLEVKLGDFGLATRIEIDGERKRTLCGTPNYIAPEVLGKKGHSYEVDIWSIGCVLYTLLVGKPPFETESLKQTYKRIRLNEYHVPSHVSPEARALITRLLHSDPASRPTPDQILADPFISKGFLPARLPQSSLTTAPHFKKMAEGRTGGGLFSRRPLSQINSATTAPTDGGKPQAILPSAGMQPLPNENPGDWHLHDLLAQITSCLEAKPSEMPEAQWDEAEDPAATPIFWVSKWVDYSDKYGLGYQLCDTSVGVLFNDCTRMLLGYDGESLQYINRDQGEEFYTMSSYPDAHRKKATLLDYFRNYMSEHLIKAGGSAGERPLEEGVRLPHLRTWFRTRSAIILHLSNGILQINFFQDHTKLVICPLMSAVSYIDESKNFRTFRLPLIQRYGTSRQLCSRLRYAQTMCDRLIAKLDSQATPPTQNTPLPPPPTIKMPPTVPMHTC